MAAAPLRSSGRANKRSARSPLAPHAQRCCLERGRNAGDGQVTSAARHRCGAAGAGPRPALLEADGRGAAVARGGAVRSAAQRRGVSAARRRPRLAAAHRRAAEDDRKRRKRCGHSRTCTHAALSELGTVRERERESGGTAVVSLVGSAFDLPPALLTRGARHVRRVLDCGGDGE